MARDIKLFAGMIIVSIVLVVGLAARQTAKKDGASAEVNNSQAVGEVAGIQASPEEYNLGDVPINGGIVTKEYEIENTTSETMKIKRITTSCMCTLAKVVLDDRETRSFGMEHAGDRNPSVNFEIPAGKKAKVVVNFDPAAHGPTGVGAFDRVVSLEFSEPAGVKEVYFDGTVVN